MSKASQRLLQLVILIVLVCFVGCPKEANSNKEKTSDNQRPPVTGEGEKPVAGSQLQSPQAGSTGETPNESSNIMENIDLDGLSRLVPRFDSDASVILADMVKTYHEANSYGDLGFVEFKYELPDGTLKTEIRNCTFAYQKPNKVRMELHRGQLVSDGTLFSAQAADNSSLIGQIIQKRAPEQIGIKDLYNDYLLTQLMDLGVPPEVLFIPPQIVLLFARDPLQTLVPEGADVRIGLPDYILSGDKQIAYPCDKIVVDDKLTGQRTYWIERDTNILMRMEFDVTRIRDTEVKPVSIKIELQDAIIDPELPSEAFMMQKLGTSVAVTELMRPDLMVLGKTPDGTVCTDEKSEQVALASPTQKGVTVAVLFVTDPQASEMCQAALQTLQQLSMLYADNASVNCFPVAVDEQTVTNSVIADTLKGWGISIPYLRQPGREIMNRLGLSNVPTFLIFGTKGTLQLIEPGLLPPEDLSQFISSALAGKEPYHDILQYFQDQKTAFYQSIDACISYDVFRTDPEYVQIAERTEPQTMSLTESWRRTEFVSPGNPHVVGSSMLITHDFQKVSVLNSDGQIMELPDSSPATITLADISEEMPLHYIRNATATDGQRYFAIAGINQKQLFLFDKDLKPVLTWPQPADADKYEIAAVQLADLTGDGTPEIVVGYRVLAENSQRLAAIDLSGKTVWENRSVTEPDQIAIVLKNKVPHVWVVNRYTETNALVEFDAAGKKLREWQVDANGGLIWKLFATDLDGDGNSEVLAALLRDGEIVVAGINPDGRVGTDASQKPLLWEHAISPGPHGVKSFEFIVTGDINDDSFGEWCVAAADGTIYFFDKTGKLLDSFASGELLSGIAIIPGDNAVTLVLTTSKDRYDDSSAEDAVIALKVTQNATPQTTAMTPPPTTPATPDVPVASEAPELTPADQTGLLSVTGEAVESDETAEFGEINEAGEVTVPPEPAPASAPNAPLLPPLPRG